MKKWSKTEKFTIKPGELEVTLPDFVVEYDGAAHGIEINLSGNSIGATVKYGTESGACTAQNSPTFIEAGDHRIYFEVSKVNYNTLKSSTILRINQKKKEK